MDIIPFGRALLDTRDLDPVYVAIHGAKLPEPQLCRLLLAYWCFYHLSEQEGPNYWQAMRVAAENILSPRDAQHGLPAGRWPRGAERRHFRGDKCVRAVRYLSTHQPEIIVRNLVDTCRSDEGIMRKVQKWPMFGPWIAFKAADMLERVYGAPIKFNPKIGLMYDEPRMGLDMLLLQPGNEGRFLGRTSAYEHLLREFARRQAPPALDRPCGPQEVETILCKWKSHMGGHYWVGKDIHEVRSGLEGWGDTARAMQKACPSEVPAQAYAA
jgi:hypothetical protein